MALQPREPRLNQYWAVPCTIHLQARLYNLAVNTGSKPWHGSTMVSRPQLMDKQNYKELTQNNFDSSTKVNS